MSRGTFSKTAITLGFVALALAGCESGVRNEYPTPQAGLSGARPLEWYEARAGVLRARLDDSRARIWTLHRDGVDLYDARSDEKLRSIALPGRRTSRFLRRFRALAG